MKRHKVLFVIESLGGGGAEKVLTTLLRHLDYSRFEVGLLSVADGGIHKTELPKEIKYYSALSLERQSGWWYRLKHRFIHRILPMWLVNRWIMPCGYDTHVAFVEGFATKLVAAGPSRLRKIAWVHTDLVKNHWISCVYGAPRDEIRDYRSFARICCVSEIVRDSMHKLYSLDFATCVVYNPVDAGEIRGKALESIEDIDYSRHSGRVRLCSVGRFEYQKAFGRLVKIIECLVVQGFDVELWLIGGGSEKTAIESYIREHGLSERIKLLGYKENPYKYMAQSDIFVCSSLAEGYSTAVSEAVILGLGVVTTDCSGMREILGDNEFGIITENDEKSLECALKDAVCDVEKLRNMVLPRKSFYDIDLSMNKIQEILMP